MSVDRLLFVEQTGSYHFCSFLFWDLMYTTLHIVRDNTNLTNVCRYCMVANQKMSIFSNKWTHASMIGEPAFARIILSECQSLGILKTSSFDKNEFCQSEIFVSVRSTEGKIVKEVL